MIAQSIRDKLQEALTPQMLDVVNESIGHNVPTGSETHFRVVAVSEVFAGERAVARHRRVYGLLESERSLGLHALALHLYTPAEWAAREQAAAPSPPCLGGGRGSSEEH